MAAALLVFTFAAGSASSASAGTVKGKVTALNGGAPIEGIEVCAFEIERFEGEVCRLTKADGTYALTGLAAGDYKVEFWRRNLNYLTQYFDHKEFFEEADEIAVSASGTVENVDAELEEGGEIEGTVTAVGGGPIAEVLVCAFEEGGEEFFFGGCAETDLNGEYDLVGLREGEYTVEFLPFSGNYQVQFYDHKGSFEEADPVAVSSGELKSGIDAELEPGAVIKGTVFSAATGSPLPFTTICLLSSGEEISGCGEVGFSGAYEFVGLPAGAYKVAFSPELKEFFPEFYEAFPELFEGEDDGYLTQYYNGKPTIATADVLSLTPPGVASGIDAHLLKPAVPARTTVAPLLKGPPPKRLHRCRKGFKKRKVKGKLRCVRVHRRHHHHRTTHPGRIVARGGTSPRLLMHLR